MLKSFEDNEGRTRLQMKRRNMISPPHVILLIGAILSQSALKYKDVDGMKRSFGPSRGPRNSKYHKNKELRVEGLTIQYVTWYDS